VAMKKIFKAKRLDNGEWVEFTLLEIGGSDINNNLYIHHIGDDVACQKHVDGKTICQYIGKNDSEGNRIFDGDELHFNPNEWGCDHRFFIEWNDKSACFDGAGVPSDWPQWCCLTGYNIHDRGEK